MSVNWCSSTSKALTLLSGSLYSKGWLRLFLSPPSRLLSLHCRSSAILTVLSTKPRLATVSRVFLGTADRQFSGIESHLVFVGFSVVGCGVLDRDSHRGSSPTHFPTDPASATGHSFLSPGFCAAVLVAGCDECKERPCVCPNTSGPWAIISSENMLTVVSMSHRVALLFVPREQTYPSQAEQIDHFQFRVVEWGASQSIATQARGC